MKRDDRIRLLHMRDAAQEAISFINERERSDLGHDRKLVLSLVKCIEIVGEAASRVSEETQRQIPQVPWPDIIGMRNRLIHAYYDIDLDRVWDTVIDDLPPLIDLLEEILAASGER